MPEKNNRGPTDVSQTGHDVAVLGGGSFGSAMAKVLGENGHTVERICAVAAAVQPTQGCRLQAGSMLCRLQ